MTGSLTVVQIYQHTSLSSCQIKKGVHLSFMCEIKVPISLTKTSWWHCENTTPLTPSAPSLSSIVATSTTHSYFPIDSISPTSPSFSFTPPAQVWPLAPRSPLAPLPPHIIQVPTNPLALEPPHVANNKALNKQLATKSISSTSPKPCKFYIRGHCRYGKKALVALIHILQCASSSLRVVIKDFLGWLL